MKLVNNFLPTSFHKEIRDLLSSEDFPWFFHENCTDYENNTVNNYGFSHLIFDRNKNLKSNYFDFFYPICYFIEDMNELIRIRIGMQTKVSETKNHINDMHYDFNNLSGDKIALYYVNNSDGDTIFFNDKKQEFFRQSPEENSILFFNGDILHSSSHPKNNSFRIAININYF
jgi:hypothetical protein